MSYQIFDQSVLNSKRNLLFYSSMMFLISLEVVNPLGLEVVSGLFSENDKVFFWTSFIVLFYLNVSVTVRIYLSETINSEIYTSLLDKKISQICSLMNHSSSKLLKEIGNTRKSNWSGVPFEKAEREEYFENGIREFCIEKKILEKGSIGEFSQIIGNSRSKEEGNQEDNLEVYNVIFTEGLKRYNESEPDDGLSLYSVLCRKLVNNFVEGFCEVDLIYDQIHSIHEKEYWVNLLDNKLPLYWGRFVLVFSLYSYFY